MNKSSDAEEVLKEALKAIKEEGPFKFRYGICQNVRHLVRLNNGDNVSIANDVLTVMHKLLQSWPLKKNGSTYYPIEGSEEAYLANDQLWSGESLELRLQLIDYMLERLG